MGIIYESIKLTGHFLYRIKFPTKLKKKRFVTFQILTNIDKLKILTKFIFLSDRFFYHNEKYFWC